MKHVLPVFLLTLLWGGKAIAQTNATVSSTEVDSILRGLYTPSKYQAATVITDPGVISAELQTRISNDSLSADLLALYNFKNRNMFSDTSLGSTTGIGAARRWVLSKFQQYSKANGSRLRPGYLWFDYSPSSAGCGSPDVISHHADVVAVLPGSQTANPSLIIIEGHMDSRNNSLCDISGSAPGIGDNATGSVLVMELARVLSKYTFRSTIVFAVVTGEEQGLIGAKALANYLSSKKVKIKAVNNNDVSGGVFCGHTASAPGCPMYGNIDSTDLRIFSKDTLNSPHKQWARYIKLEYKEMQLPSAKVPVNINIMELEDRTGRGGDHQAFTAIGYTGVRFTQANEDGDASNGNGYTDRQHNIRDSLGRDKNGDGVIDSFYINLDYLNRNTLVNGNSLAMVALGPDTITLIPSLITANQVRVLLKPAGAPAYRVAVRSLSNDWDSVFTISNPAIDSRTGDAVDTITVPYGSNSLFYISAAADDANMTESQFSSEYTLTTKQVILALPPDTGLTLPPSDPGYYGIQLLPNRPNPFDESTLITVTSGTDIFADRTMIQITSMDGRVVARTPLHLVKGINQIVMNHGFNAAGIYICSLVIDGLPAQSKKMVFRTH